MKRNSRVVDAEVVFGEIVSELVLELDHVFRVFEFSIELGDKVEDLVDISGHIQPRSLRKSLLVQNSLTKSKLVKEPVSIMVSSLECPSDGLAIVLDSTLKILNSSTVGPGIFLSRLQQVHKLIL